MKNKMNIVLLISGCLLTLLSCSNKSDENKSLEGAAQKTTTEPTEIVSKLIQGGLVVYEKDGHGLIAATTDLGKFEWTNALKVCDELVLNGFSDWRLPTKEELNTLLKSHGVGEFASSSYWSSSEYNNYYAWRQNFDAGRVDRRGNKSKKNYVRAVRSF